ncbi:hypothetical protein HPB49_026274 [Dermacentor silvarum]|nr:hypothetical protein HPB49_026274 [Dermacentor silvarum]
MSQEPPNKKRARDNTRRRLRVLLEISSSDVGHPNLAARISAPESSHVPSKPVSSNATVATASKLCSKDDILATPEITPNDKCKVRLSLHSAEPLNRRECAAIPSKAVKVESSFIGEHEVIVNEQSVPKALVESDVVDITRQLREEDDLMEAVRPSQTQVMFQVYGTVTAFLDLRPGFRVVLEDLCSFEYYQGPDDEEAWSCTSLLQGGATAASGSARSSYSGRQHAKAIDGGPRRARICLSSSSAYESAIDRNDEEQEKRRINDCWSLRLHLLVCHKASSKARTKGLDPALFAELESTLRKRVAETTDLREGLETFRVIHSSELQELRVKIYKTLQVPQTVPPLSSVELKKCTANKEQKPTGMNKTDSRPWSRPPLRQMYPSIRPWPEEKQRSIAIDARTRPLPAADNCSGGTQSGCRKEEVAAPCPDVESTWSSQEELTAKGKMQQQVSKIVRMGKKWQPSYSGQELRTGGAHLRLSWGGFAPLTSNAIVALFLGHLKTTPEEGH